MDQVRSLIARTIEARGLDLKEVSLELGKNHAYLQQFLRRGIPRELSEKVRGRLAELLDVPEEKLGGKPARSASPAMRGDVASLSIHGGLGIGSTEVVEAGRDGPTYSEHVNGFWSFPDAVKAGWRNLPNVFALPVQGDSMAPTLASGSHVFVDVSHNVPQPEDIYACDYGDGLAIKRLQLIPRSDMIRVISDNDHYQSFELLRSDVCVYGRVVAWFQWRG